LRYGAVVAAALDAVAVHARHARPYHTHARFPTPLVVLVLHVKRVDMPGEVPVVALTRSGGDSVRPKSKRGEKERDEERAEQG
jgi:hypothetical protein